MPELITNAFGLNKVSIVAALESALLQFGPDGRLSAAGRQNAITIIETFDALGINIDASRNQSLALVLAAYVGLPISVIRLLLKDPNVDPDARLPGGLSAVEAALLGGHWDIYLLLVSEFRGTPTPHCIIVASLSNNFDLLRQTLPTIPENTLADITLRIQTLSLIANTCPPEMLHMILESKPAWAEAMARVEKQDGTFEYINVFNNVLSGVIGNIFFTEATIMGYVLSVLEHRRFDDVPEQYHDDNAFYKSAIVHLFADIATRIHARQRIRNPEQLYTSIVDELPKMAPPAIFDVVTSHLHPGDVSEAMSQRLIRHDRVYELTSFYHAGKVPITSEVLTYAALETDDDASFANLFLSEYETLDETELSTLSREIGRRGRPSVLRALLTTDLIDIEQVYRGLLNPGTLGMKARVASMLELIIGHNDIPPLKEVIKEAFDLNATVVFLKLKQQRLAEFGDHFKSSMDKKERKAFVRDCLNKEPQRLEILGHVQEAAAILNLYPTLLTGPFETACRMDNDKLVSFLAHASGLNFDLHYSENLGFTLALESKSWRVYKFYLQKACTKEIEDLIKAENHLNAIVANAGDQEVAILCAPFATADQRNAAVIGAVDHDMRAFIHTLISVHHADAKTDDSKAIRRAAELNKDGLVELLAKKSDPTANKHELLFWPIQHRNSKMFSDVVAMKGINLYFNSGAVLNKIAEIKSVLTGKRFLNELFEKNFKATAKKLSILYGQDIPSWMRQGLEREFVKLGKGNKA